MDGSKNLSRDTHHLLFRIKSQDKFHVGFQRLRVDLDCNLLYYNQTRPPPRSRDARTDALPGIQEGAAQGGQQIQKAEKTKIAYIGSRP